MDIVLIIFCVVLVLSVAAHFFLWRDGKRRYDETIRRIASLNKKLMQLEANNVEIDKMLDEAEDAIDRIDEGIEDLRSERFMRMEKPTFDN